MKRPWKEILTDLEYLWDQSLLGNYAQRLGISGRGTKEELIKKIKKKLKELGYLEGKK